MDLSTSEKGKFLRTNTFEEDDSLKHKSDSVESDEGSEKVFNFDILFSFDGKETTAFIRAAVKCILIESMDQLYVLRNINSQDSSDFTEDVMDYHSIEARFMGMENHAEYRINSVLTNQSKLAKDINMIISIIKETCDEIDFMGTYNVFMIAVNAIKRMYEDDKQLLDIRDKNVKYIIDLRNQCEEERLYNIQTMDETNAKIQKLRFEVEDALVYGKCEVGYFEDWERVRQEQNDMVCHNRESVFTDTIDGTEKKILDETRCHTELDNYIEESKNDYLDEIQFWMKHYDEEIERRENEQVTLQNEYEKLIEDHNALKAKFKAHKEEMDDWLEYKRIKKEKEEREALEIWAAIKIQAWWRGTMVRKKLGPYAKKKGKGKGKDKDKGKGKKK